MKSKLIKRIITLTTATITVLGMLSVGASASWRQNGYGWWNQEGNRYSIGWEKLANKWYYFNQDGYMRTGWINDSGKWYYLNSNGDMATGWIKDGGKWYYLDQSGIMLFNAFISGYRLGADGAWIDDNLPTVTTGAAVTVTTGAAVTDTTGAAANLPVSNYDNYLQQYGNQNSNSQNYQNYLNKYNNDKNRLENLAYKYQQKLDEQTQKMQQKLNEEWWYLHR